MVKPEAAKKTKGELTRERLIAVAAELFQAKGYQAIGLNEICTVGGLPKGSMYYHFPKGKEEIAVAVIEASKLEIGANIEAARGMAASVDQFVDLLNGHFSQNLSGSDFTKGCPITTINLEMASESESIRKACDAAFAHWTDQCAAFLVSSGFASEKSKELAEFLLAAIEGAMILARAEKSVAPLNRAASHIKLYLA
ncbi:TetR/AcrR family transcriptional regulator [Maritalea sp.]|uniref:TetR/AcrR family transcriptional regulator n=1 Tax=Maritalea sp. TaxID=2003361 RepID=UPI003EF793B4